MILSVGVFLILHYNIDTIYKQSLCSIEFFCCLPSELVCIILWGYTQCDFCHVFSAAVICLPSKNCAEAYDDTFLVPNKPHGNCWRDSEKVWSSARRMIYLHIGLSRCISLYFLSASVALNTLSVYQLFHDFENFLPLFGRFQFLAPTCFLRVIYPRYNPDIIIINWNMRNISTHSRCLFLYGIFFYIALYFTWKLPHVQCKHKLFLNFGFMLITYMPFPFSFSLLYNSSSFYQCLHFLWHLVIYKLLTKILLSPSFCLRSSILY